MSRSPSKSRSTASKPAPAPAGGAASPPRRPGLPGVLWSRIRDYSGFEPGTSYLWPRWLVLRAVGVVYLFIFGGILRESAAILGPQGIVPLEDFLAQVRAVMPGPLDAFIGAPSLFWLSSSPGTIAALGWIGFAAAAAVTLNLAPRYALAACWALFLSFAATWRNFSPAQLDNLMLEVALLCIPFAPAGLRPGLGASAPPLPLVVCMLRWLLFRIMFEAGIVKFSAGDLHWRDLTAMEVMYETSPFPTVLAYWDHHLPHAYHLFEIALTFVAELLAPVAAVFGGRRGRWFAFLAWTALQAGIQLTSNFGWLNVAAIGFGLLLFDDQMLRSLAARWRLPFATADAPVAAGAPALSVPRQRTRWSHRLLAAGLWVHFTLALVYFAKACGLPPGAVPAVLAWPMKVVSGFRSVNEYSLYAAFDSGRYQVEFEGSNDGGRTWRSYEYRLLPQRPTDMAPFLAPRFARFEATMQIFAARGRKSPVYSAVAARLLEGSPEVVGLFRRNPFPDRPPTVVRMRGYRFAFLPPESRRRTGRYWRKEFAGDHLPALHRNSRGEIAAFDPAPADAALQRGNAGVAYALFEQQFEAGNLDAGYRLAELLARGALGRPDPARAFALMSELAQRGEVAAEHNVGASYEYGVGVAVDYAAAERHYRAAADRGYVPALYSLGALRAQGRIAPADDVKALALLLRSQALARGEDPASQFVRTDRAGHVKRLLDRMAPGEIARARQLATQEIE